MDWDKGLSKDIFSLIIKHLDGRDCARCSVVCKSWKGKVSCSERARVMMSDHFIKITDINKLEGTIALNEHGSGLREKKSSEGNFVAFMWYMFGINVHLSVKDTFTFDFRKNQNFERFCRNLGRTGEHERSLIDNDGNLYWANNSYGGDPSEKNFHVRIDWMDEQVLPNLQDLERMTNGAFTWRIISFPFQGDGGFCLNPKDTYSFHRGKCFCIIAKVHRLMPLLPIETIPMDNLKKTSLVKETLGAVIGKGQKRRIWKRPEEYREPEDPTSKVVTLFKRQKN